MIVTKPGNKKYVTVSNVTIHEGTCNDCGAKFEIQEGELYLLRGPELNRPMPCPYCRKYHTDYTFRELRTDTMLLHNVINYDPDRNPTWEVIEGSVTTCKV
jgi:hypothetical protein